MLKGYNPFYNHSDDKLKVGLLLGAKASLQPKRGEPVGLVEAGVVSHGEGLVKMAHSFGARSHPFPSELFPD